MVKGGKPKQLDVVYTCGSCGKPFHPIRHDQHYCSALCRRDRYRYGYHLKTLTKICPVCGQQFTTRKAVQTYCSTQCARAKDNMRRKGTAVTPDERICPVCGVTFHSAHCNKTYCSRECYIEAKNKREGRHAIKQ